MNKAGILYTAKHLLIGATIAVVVGYATVMVIGFTAYFLYVLFFTKNPFDKTKKQALYKHAYSACGPN